jgi:hypothetical protein
MVNQRFAMLRKSGLTSFALCSAKGADPVGKEVSIYEQRCDEEMLAAENSSSHKARLAHLELALRFAILANRARQGSAIVGLKRRSADPDPSS